jgi:hypothetical protein
MALKAVMAATSQAITGKPPMIKSGLRYFRDSFMLLRVMSKIHMLMAMENRSSDNPPRTAGSSRHPIAVRLELGIDIEVSALLS